MSALMIDLAPDDRAQGRVEVLFQEQLGINHRRTDRRFAWLMLLQWPAMVAAALWISPRAWAGTESHIHIHVWAAVFLGGLITGFPVFLALTRPGLPSTRHVIAVGQMLTSGLLVHLTGGRIETHFGYFGSLAFLAFYRDWRVLLTASLVVGADHFLRGVYWPQSLFGVLNVNHWRWLEHVGWVLFEDVFLFLGIRQNLRETRGVAERQAKLETVNDTIERAVDERTSELRKEILERQRAEQSLRLLNSAMEQAKESIIITDAELDLPGPRIIYVNPAFTAMTGYAASEAIGKTPRILQGPNTDRTLLDRLRKNLERGEMFAGEGVNYRKDGREFTLEWQIAPLKSADGKITHFVAMQRDITERRRLEDQLFESQKLETVGKLAGGVAHEFNSILTAIIGQCESLVSDLPAGGQNAHRATEISHAATRAATLTRQLLAYGRKQFLQLETLDLNVVVAGMEGALRHLLGSAVELQIVLSGKPLAAKVDAAQMEQVIINMVINAGAAMPQGGKLTLQTTSVSFDEGNTAGFEAKPGDYVLLAITDTGVGMSAEVRARVFEPFFSTKGVGGGTGLGLSTCHGIIKQSGGHIDVLSEVGQGTTFKIYLPQVEFQPKAPTQRQDTPGLPQGTATVLLVEDDHALSGMAAKLLRRLGYTVLTASNGAEALNFLQPGATGQIDLLLTELVMPNMSGEELADKARAAYPQIKILFTAANTENAGTDRGIKDSGAALLQKPFTPTALARELRELLDRPDLPQLVAGP